MPTPASFFEPRSLVWTTTTNREELFNRYFSTEATANRSSVPSDLVQKSAIFLETIAVGACVWEALEELGADSIKASPESWPYFRDYVRRMSGVDAEALAVQLRSLPSKSGPDPELAARPPREVMTRVVRSSIEACPIDELEAFAAMQGQEALGFQCRVAYDSLRAFVHRNSEFSKARTQIVGTLYALGRFSSIEQAALLLDVSVPDVVALLESNGYRRSPEAMALSDSDREDRLLRVRTDRLSRGGRPSPSDARVSRDAIASERLENVDARRWMVRDRS